MAGRKRKARNAKPAAEPSGARPPSPAPPWRRAEWQAAAAVFVAAFLARVLFARALPDRAWTHGVFLKGDAPLWADYARALRDGRPFELGLPIHPPGTAYLLAALWDGSDSGMASVKLAWAAMGALAVLFFFLAARRSFGLAAGAMVGLATAASTGLLVLSGSVDSETPYLALVAITLWLFEDVRAGPHPGRVAAWSALCGLCCLFRVEHALFYGLALALAGLWWRRRAEGPWPWSRIGLGTLVSVAAFATPLLPWQLRAWSSIDRFNSELPGEADPGQRAVRRVAATLSWMAWDDAARAERDRWPAFAREAASAFVAATVLHRGSGQVGAQDLGILDEGFGSRPRALPRAPFVSLYGPLNFALANHPSAQGGFSRAALEDPPPLAADAGRYPPFLAQGLPPPDLSFVYPPHVQLVTGGYGIGWRWIRARGPLGAAAHVWRKLRLFWWGAALGFTGYDAPLGLPRLRRAVDLAVPAPGWRTGLWSVLLLVVCGLGVAAGRGQPALGAWLLFLLSKVAVTAAFFGYARQGALVIPVVALLVALAALRWWPAARRAGPEQVVRATLLAAVAVVAVEAARAARPPDLQLDGRPLEAGDAGQIHRDQTIAPR